MIPMIEPVKPVLHAGGEDRLTCREDPALRVSFGVRMRPDRLARGWSTGGDRPPSRHVQHEFHDPRGRLRDWPGAQVGDLRVSAPSAARGVVMAEVQLGGARRSAIPTAAELRLDPAVSYAPKEGLLEWAVRDPVDAARDAWLLAEVLARRADEAVPWAP